MNQTVEVQTSELTGAALDWAVAMSEGATNLYFDTVACWWFTLNGVDRVLSSGWSDKQNYCPSTDWRYGGPLIEDHGIFLLPRSNAAGWDAYIELDTAYDCWSFSAEGYGPTPLTAAMRCLVASKLGDTVQVPAELI